MLTKSIHVRSGSSISPSTSWLASHTPTPPFSIRTRHKYYVISISPQTTAPISTFLFSKSPRKHRLQVTASKCKWTESVPRRTQKAFFIILRSSLYCTRMKTTVMLLPIKAACTPSCIPASQSLLRLHSLTHRSSSTGQVRWGQVPKPRANAISTRLWLDDSWMHT